MIWEKQTGGLTAQLFDHEHQIIVFNTDLTPKRKLSKYKEEIFPRLTTDSHRCLVGGNVQYFSLQIV